MNKKVVSEELIKHKIDILVSTMKYDLAVEVNLCHGEIARQKMEVYRAYLAKINVPLLEIEANECESLFNDIPYVTWHDWIDVINAFKTAELNYEEFTK